MFCHARIPITNFICVSYVRSENGCLHINLTYFVCSENKEKLNTRHNDAEEEWHNFEGNPRFHVGWTLKWLEMLGKTNVAIKLERILSENR